MLQLYARLLNKMAKKINNIREELSNTELQVTALAMYLDVNASTVSKWNSNSEQPSLKRLDEIGHILEVNNTELVYSSDRKFTGLANALQIQYKKLLKSGLKKKIKSIDTKGQEIEINNPAFVKALRDFVEEYMKDSK